VWHASPIDLALIASEEINFHAAKPVTKLNGLRVSVSNCREAINVSICHSKDIGWFLSHGVAVVLIERDALGRMAINQWLVRNA
jgi:hypothetical protein